jgi:hypothetical protein
MGRELTLVDLRREPLEFLPGDKLLGASDGILTLPESRIVQLLEEHNGRTAEELSSILVEAVAQAGNPHQDNVTVMLAAAPPADAAPAGKRRFMPGWLLPDRKAAETALRRLLQPRVLAGLGAVFLIAAVAFGLFTGRSSEQEASGNPAPAADAPPLAPKASAAPAQRDDAIEAKAQQVPDGDKTKEEAPAVKEAPAEGEAQPR